MADMEDGWMDGWLIGSKNYIHAHFFVLKSINLNNTLFLTLEKMDLSFICKECLFLSLYKSS